MSNAGFASKVAAANNTISKRRREGTVTCGINRKAQKVTRKVASQGESRGAPGFRYDNKNQAARAAGTPPPSSIRRHRDQPHVEEPPRALAFFHAAEKLPARLHGGGKGARHHLEITGARIENSGHLDVLHAHVRRAGGSADERAANRKSLELLRRRRTVAILLGLEQFTFGHRHEQRREARLLFARKRGDKLRGIFSAIVIAQQ